MTALTETLHAGGFIVSEANGYRSRDEVTIDESQTLVTGQVVMLNHAGTKWVAYDDDSFTDAAAGGILYDAVTTATGENKPATIIARDAEVDGTLLNWGGNDTGDEDAGKVDLAALGIVIRTGTTVTETA